MRLILFILAAVALLGGVVFFATPAIKEARRSKIIEKEIENLRADAEKINADNSFLKEKIEYLKSDHYRESVAKDRLDLRNAGEKVVVVQLGSENNNDNVANEQKDDIINNEVGPRNENISNYEKWWNIVIEKDIN